MTDTPIPAEAVEAAAREITLALIASVDEDTRALALTDDERRELATAALTAGIAAWPGMQIAPPNVWDTIELHPASIILPLQEPPHDR